MAKSHDGHTDYSFDGGPGVASVCAHRSRRKEILEIVKSVSRILSRYVDGEYKITLYKKKLRKLIQN